MARRLSHAHWGAFEALTEGGRIVGVEPFARDPDPSVLLRSVPDAVHSDLRIREPMVREGYLKHGQQDAGRKRGGEPFVPVSWDRALALVADGLLETRAAGGNESIFGGSYGWSSAGRINHARTLLHRFLYRIGGCVDQVTNYSWGAAAILLPHVVGGIEPVAGPVSDWPTIVEHTELMVLFGGAPARNQLITTGGAGAHESPGWFRAARDAGVRFLSISPSRADMPEELGAEWLPIRPGSDTALILALAHTLIETGRADLAFLQRYTVGYETFRDYVLGVTDGTPKTAGWAASLTGIGEAVIRDLAGRMASSRTMITATWSLQRADHGEQPYWAIVALAAMLGQIGLPGGGFGFGYGSINGMGVPRRPVSAPAMEAGRNPLGLAIPVARMADLLLEPGRTIPFDGKSVTFPDIRFVYWCGGNPFHHHQDLNRLIRAWQRPRTVVVQDIWWTATARHADIVLPATTSFERDDIGASPRDRFLVAMPQLVPPQFSARNDYDIFSDLAARLGVAASYTEGRDIAGWVRHAYERCRKRALAQDVDLPPFDAFWERGFAEIPPPAKTFTLFESFRSDPDRFRLATSSGRIEIFSETIAGFGYADCPGHPVWLPPKEWLGAPGSGAYPLHLLSGQPSTRLHSQLDDAQVSRLSKIAGHEPILMNAGDARARKICDGDVVRVFNGRGACLAGAVTTPDLLPGVAHLATGAWYMAEEAGAPGALELNGNPNVLTRDEGTSALGQGPSAQSLLVEVELYRAGGESPVTPPVERD